MQDVNGAQEITESLLRRSFDPKAIFQRNATSCSTKAEWCVVCIVGMHPGTGGFFLSVFEGGEGGAWQISWKAKPGLRGGMESGVGEGDKRSSQQRNLGGVKGAVRTTIYIACTRAA